MTAAWELLLRVGAVGEEVRTGGAGPGRAVRGLRFRGRCRP
ncbi:hypothetical protein F750_5646 [Streptomyces sp. PAMC 26508]|nr:hypothetical protein F750_5646 [Streptomyces sp. PAMC 26508]